MQHTDTLLRVLRPGREYACWVRPDNVTQEDVILEGDLRLLHYAEAVQGMTRMPVHTEYRRDTDRLVYVRRRIRRNGTEFLRRIWVAGDNVRPGDEIIDGEQNVRPSRYAQAGARRERPAFQPPRSPHRDSALSRHETALFTALLELMESGD